MPVGTAGRRPRGSRAVQRVAYGSRAVTMVMAPARIALSNMLIVLIFSISLVAIHNTAAAARTVIVRKTGDPSFNVAGSTTRAGKRSGDAVTDVVTNVSAVAPWTPQVIDSERGPSDVVCVLPEAWGPCSE